MPRLKNEKEASKAEAKRLKQIQAQQKKDSGQEVLGEQCGDGENIRQRYWLDDLIACVFGPLIRVPNQKAGLCIDRMYDRNRPSLRSDEDRLAEFYGVRAMV